MAAAGVGFIPHLPLLFFKKENTEKSYLTYRRFSIFKNVNLTAIKTGLPRKKLQQRPKKTLHTDNYAKTILAKVQNYA